MRERQKHRSRPSSIASLNTQDSLEQFKQKFPERFFVRLHMTVLLSTLRPRYSLKPLSRRCLPPV
jgi:hypothetical protein